MSDSLIIERTVREQDRRISEVVKLERARLRNFIRRRVSDERDAEDILQDVFYEFVEAYRMMKPIEFASAWLYRVARNRITDLFRRKKPEVLGADPVRGEADEEALLLEDLLPSPDAGPDAAYARSVLIEELVQSTGLNINTLILRKHYAVIHLRERLEAIHKQFQGT